ncbi:MAG TPA: TusE/DsrC/DsvC family sulfur relay protein [Nitrospirota bacterium]|nr:TusE/DsrC/DsvC family sulfur relay protein [Nitrospirota bacterium]
MTVPKEYSTSKKKMDVDDEGYLVNFNDWNEEVARELAARAGIGELTTESIVILKFIRDYYKAYTFFPIVHSICTKLHEPKDCVTEKFFNPLIAWKIAGLPHPEEPINSLLEAGQSPG